MEQPGAGIASAFSLEWFDRALHLIAAGFEAIGVAVIALGLAAAIVQALRRVLRGEARDDLYHPFRTTLARGILLGLEFMVAADIIGTVAVAPTLENLVVLGLIVLIRTFLSFSLQLEITGRWPWQPAPRRDAGDGA
jgi:uncharacterized membrane protein